MNPLLPAWILAGNIALMLGGWLVSRRIRNAGVADLLWPISLCASALYFAATASGSPTSKILVVIMGGLWGTRLFLHLLERFLSEHEDFRYRHVRESRPNAELVFFLLFLHRAITASLFSLSFQVAAGNALVGATFWTTAAAILYLAGLAGQTYADRQLERFRTNPRHLGESCRRGLWRYSRHPNYFFEGLIWCSYAVLAVGVPWTIWSLTLIAPALTIIGWLPAMRANEAQALRTRGEDYRRYQSTTSAVLPWFPRGWPNDLPPETARPTPPPPSRRVRFALDRPEQAGIASLPARTDSTEQSPESRRGEHVPAD